MANRRKVIITCAVTGSDPHADRCRRIFRSRRRRSPRPRSARRRRVRRSCICMRAIPSTAGRRRTRTLFRQFLPEIKQRSNVVINITTGGAATMSDRGAAAARAAAQARGRVAQHGLDELRPVPDAAAVQGMQARLGAQVSRRQSDERIFKNTFKDIEYILTSCAATHALRDRVLRHRPPVHGDALPRSRRRQAAAVHPDRCSASSAASARIPRTSLHMKRTADRLFGDQYRWSRARRRPQSDVDRDAVGGDGRQRARRARGQPVDRAGHAGRIAMPRRCAPP